MRPKMIYKISDFIDKILSKYKKQKLEQINVDEATRFYKDVRDTEDLEKEMYKEKAKKLVLFEPTIWEEEQFLLSRYQKKYLKDKNTKTKIKMEISENLSYNDVKPKSLARELTILDLRILKDIHASELIEYDGTEECETKCKNMLLLKRKNDLLLNMVNCDLLDDKVLVKFYIKLCKKLNEFKNYNSLSVILAALKRQKLSEKYYNEVAELINISSDYFEMRNLLDTKVSNKEFCLVPIEIILKDTEESNKNRESEIASENFCKMIEFFVEMQQKELECKSKKKIEHWLLTKLCGVSETQIEEEEVVIHKKEIGSFYLFL